MADLTTIRNIGPAFAKALTGIGIDTAEALRDIGADKAYARLLAAGHKPHFIGYYVLHMALQGRPWNDCKGKEKDDLRRRFDALKVVHLDQDRTALEDALDRIGVVRPRV